MRWSSVIAARVRPAQSAVGDGLAVGAAVAVLVGLTLAVGVGVA